jgi:hypothetical protein
MSEYYSNIADLLSEGENGQTVLKANHRFSVLNFLTITETIV